MTVESLIGQTLDGRYRVLSHLGEGGMGTVYKAEHIAMEQPVAIKVLLTESTNDPSMVKRFIREARSCFKIDHPNCVRVTDFGASENGSLYFAMEYLDGRTIGIDLHVDGAMSSRRVRHIASQVAQALHHAHGLGLIHRDLKPANIMLVHRDGDPDFVKVFDFGLGKLVDEGAMLTGLTMSPLTQEGIVFGTPEYMSPEQARGEPVTGASDLYTLGVCCYEMLTGCLPFMGKTFTEILSKHVTEAPIPPSQRFPEMAFDPQLEAVVMGCLSKDPRERPSGADLAATLALHKATTVPALISSQTLVVSEESMAALGQPMSQSDAEASLIGGISRRNKLVVPGLAVVVAALLVITVFSLTADTDEKTQAIANTTDSTPIGAASDDAALPDPSPAEVDEFDASVGPSTHEPAKANKRPKKPIPDKHLAAAEAAFRSGNVLKQLSEAHASLKAHRKSRRAAFLVGDALRKSGDKVAACKFFRRAGKKHYRAAGCSN